MLVIDGAALSPAAIEVVFTVGVAARPV